MLGFCPAFPPQVAKRLKTHDPANRNPKQCNIHV